MRRPSRRFSTSSRNGWMRASDPFRHGALLDALLRPAELLYRGLSGGFHAAWDHGVRKPQEAPLPVISVGNLVVGGSGKTPFTAFLVRMLLERGERPAVLHGGYAADEPELHRLWTPQVPVFAARDRVASAVAAAARRCTVALLDDGFQHRRLERNLDIVLVPAESWRLRPRLLPRGPWREPVSALRRADLVVVTRRAATAEAAEQVAAEVAGQVGADRVARAVLEPAGFTSGDGPEPPGSVLAVAAIGMPDGFTATLEAAGVSVGELLAFRDHHEYTEADVRGIVQAAEGRAVVTTEKDWVKLRRFDALRDIWVLRLGVRMESGAPVLDRALDAVLS
jgi:tetraacyldisaccharide 4'-kinase